MSLTAAGGERQATTQRAIHAMEERLLAHLSSDDRDVLRHLLDRALTVPGGS